ncbi:50S ribosomal protein L2 [Candidatus Vidania fulgoroideorum]
MIIKKPITPGLRGMVCIEKKSIYHRNIKKLKLIIKKSPGRNNQGKITVRHRAKGEKKKYRVIDFLRNKKFIKGIIKSIEYDPYRNCNISLVSYSDGDYKYIIHLEGLKIGEKIINADFCKPKIGNCMIIKNIPIGFKICCIENIPDKGAKIVRTAGNYAIIYSKDRKFTKVKFRNGKFKNINNFCKAVIGVVDNCNYYQVKIGKAGIKIRKGIRPTVRGVAMNPVDHPHGGGEGKTTSKRHPVSYKGKLTKGFKTSKK